MAKKNACEVCGGQLSKGGAGTFEWGASCGRCGTGYSNLFRKDGAQLGVPRSWGKLVAVVQEIQNLERADSNSLAEGVSPDFYDLHSDFWYVFQDEDGTVRRAYVYHSCWKENERPKGVPSGVNYYHAWQVDVLPAN